MQSVGGRSSRLIRFPHSNHHCNHLFAHTSKRDFFFPGPPQQSNASAKAWSSHFVRHQHTRQDGQTSIETAGDEVPPVDSVRPPSLLRPVLFTLVVTTGLYFGAAALTSRSDEKSLRFSRALLLGPSLANPDSDLRGTLDSQQGGLVLARLRSLGVPVALQERYADLHRWWSSQRPSQRATKILIGLNTLVFLGFQMPNPIVKALMRRSFTHSPLTGRSYTILTSMFGHSSFLHFAVNMLGLNSFGPIAFEYLELQRRQYPRITDDAKLTNIYSTYHHVAFFISAGMIANIVPHAINMLYTLPRMRAALTSTSENVIRSLQRKLPSSTSESASATLPHQLLPSLGASGAIYSTLVVSALAYPDASVFLIFFPWVPIKIGYATLGIVTFDVVGILRGWQLFGHWAHLTGAAVGALAYYLGEGRLWFEVQRIVEGDRLPKHDSKSGSEIRRRLEERRSR